MGSLRRGAAQTVRGLAAAVTARPGTLLAAAAGLAAASVLLPPLVLSLARKPADYFTFNPWLGRLPEYLGNPDVPIAVKAEKLWALVIFWFSSDSPMGGTEWGFAVGVSDLARIALTSLLFGLYVALWRLHRDQRARLGGIAIGAWSRRPSGMLGAVSGVVGLSTGPCSVMGCGAPVLPVVGLAFAGLSSGTLAWLAAVSTVVAVGVPAAIGLGVVHLGWLTGQAAAR